MGIRDQETGYLRPTLIVPRGIGELLLDRQIGSILPSSDRGVETIGRLMVEVVDVAGPVVVVALSEGAVWQAATSIARAIGDWWATRDESTRIHLKLRRGPRVLELEASIRGDHTDEDISRLRDALVAMLDD